MRPPIFLSASIPIPGREPYDQDIQTKRIRDAVLALVTVCRDRKLTLVFGGHPAISPLVHHASNNLGIVQHIFIYQSRFYEDKLPAAARKFPNLRWTAAGEDAESSQRIMRDAMIGGKEWDYRDAVFIGGMEGIFDEARRFHSAYPDRPMIPLQQTGGATRMLLKEVDPTSKFPWRMLDSEERATTMLRYRRLLEPTLSEK
jgi:hypothetical protein